MIPLETKREEILQTINELHIQYLAVLAVSPEHKGLLNALHHGETLLQNIYDRDLFDYNPLYYAGAD